MINDITLTSIETITLFDLVTGAYRFTLDELQNVKIAQSEEKTDITGKQGRKLSSLKKNKAVTITGTNGLVSGGLMELQTGGTFEDRETTVLWVDYLTVAGNAAATTYTAVGTAGNEIESVYVKNSDGTLGEPLTQDTAAAQGKFTYTPATKALAFNSGELKDGTEIVVYYMRKISASVLDNVSDSYSGKSVAYIDALGEDKCGVVYRVQVFVPKADFSGNFELDIGENQTVHAFELEALSGACGSGGSFFTYTVFGGNEADIA